MTTTSTSTLGKSSFWLGFALVVFMRDYMGLWALPNVALVAWSLERWTLGRYGTCDRKDFWMTVGGALAAVVADFALYHFVQMVHGVI